MPGAFPSPTGARDRYLDAAIDRVLVAAVDIADGDPADVPLVPGHVLRRAATDRLAVGTAVEAILGRSWGPQLPWHGRMDVEALADRRVAGWRRAAEELGPTGRHGTDLVEEVWATAELVALAARDARLHGHGERRGLTGVLAAARSGLTDPDGAWDDRLTTLPVARPARYRLQVRWDRGSRRLLLPGDDTTWQRWGGAVDHFDLPVPMRVARRVQACVDAGPPALDALAELCTELGRALGPAYALDVPR